VEVRSQSETRREPRNNSLHSTIILSQHRIVEANDNGDNERRALARAHTWGAPRRRAKTGSINHSAAQTHSLPVVAVDADDPRGDTSDQLDSPGTAPDTGPPGPALLYFDPAIEVGHEHRLPRTMQPPSSAQAMSARRASTQRAQPPNRSRPTRSPERSSSPADPEDLYALVLDESAPLFERYRAMCRLSDFTPPRLPCSRSSS
jgi:hypothetical protein